MSVGVTAATGQFCEARAKLTGCVTAHLRVLRADGGVAVVRHRARPRRGEEAVRPVVRACLGERVSASP